MIGFFSSCINPYCLFLFNKRLYFCKIYEIVIFRKKAISEIWDYINITFSSNSIRSHNTLFPQNVSCPLLFMCRQVVIVVRSLCKQEINTLIWCKLTTISFKKTMIRFSWEMLMRMLNLKSISMSRSAISKTNHFSVWLS